MRILGIDPGSRFTGYGVIDVHGRQVRYVASGVVRVADEVWPTRLQSIFRGVRAVVDEFQPSTLAIEKVFVHRNAESALKLGQARGAALCAALVPGVDVCEYSPNQIKQAIVGRGHAAKEQVQHMIRLLLTLPEAPSADSADALAVALCHAHTSQTVLATNVAAPARGARRWRQVPEALLPRVKQGGSR
jgi:crossover junction endodeoxyribonuclease RuvC